MRKPATEGIPRIVVYPHGRRVDRLLYQPMHTTLRPHAHRMEHEVSDVGLLSLVHHVVMFVNMKNIRRCDTVGVPSSPPSCERVIVPLDNRGDRTMRPPEKTTKLVTRVRHQIEVVEVDIENGVHGLLSHAEQVIERLSAYLSFKGKNQ